MTINEVSKKYDISADTLRYYEKVGVIPPVPRTKSGIRNYDESSCEWISLAKCMRQSGVSIEALVEYVRLFNVENSREERLNILIEQRALLQQKLIDTQETLDRLNHKISLYVDGKIK